MMSFLICLQAMIIVAWNGSGDLSAVFEADVFKKVLSVFITASILKLGQGRLCRTSSRLKYGFCTCSCDIHQ